MNKLAALPVVFLLLFVIFRTLELRLPKDRRTPLRRRGIWTDLSYWLFNPVVAEHVVGAVSLILVVVFALFVYGRVDRLQILSGFGPASRLPLAVQAICMLVLTDFIGYWVHRLFHGRRLWRFHAVHHSSQTLDWLSAARAHPVNEIASRLAIMFPLLALGFSLKAAAWIGPFIGFFGLLLHANLDWDWGPFRTVLASPRFHRWHHTSEEEGLNQNFAALFPVWDILFGTYYMPQDRCAEHFGTTTPVPDGLIAQLAFPFRRTSGALPTPQDQALSRP